MAFGYPGYNQPYQPNYPGQQMYGQSNYPQYGQPQQQMQAQNGLNRVTGLDGARAFAVPPNSVVPLFDDTQDVFYIKTTDSGGFPTIKPYRFAPMEEAPVQQTQGLTRPEIEQIIREEIAKYEQQLIQSKQQRNTGGKYESGNPKSGGSNEQLPAIPSGDAGQRPGGNA